MTHQLHHRITHRDVQVSWLEAWTKAAKSTTELAWVELYRQPMQLGRVCAVGALQMQAEFVRNCTALMSGGLFDAERIGELCNEYAQLTDQVCEDQMQACERFLELAQAVPGVPLQQLREVTFEYLEFFKEFPASRVPGAEQAPAPARSPERVRGRREEKAA